MSPTRDFLLCVLLENKEFVQITLCMFSFCNTRHLIKWPSSWNNQRTNPAATEGRMQQMKKKIGHLNYPDHFISIYQGGTHLNLMKGREGLRAIFWLKCLIGKECSASCRQGHILLCLMQQAKSLISHYFLARTIGQEEITNIILAKKIMDNLIFPVCLLDKTNSLILIGYWFIPTTASLDFGPVMQTLAGNSFSKF